MRDAFPILSRTTYLNSCSLGALSTRSEARLRTFLDEWHALGASAWYGRWLDRLEELRARVARLIGARPAEVALEASTSAALAVVASALDYRRRPRVVVAALDFPTLAYQWLAREGVQVVHVPSDDGATIDLERFADAVDDRTAIVATSHVFYATGAIQDLRALADIAHGSGALLLVDAYQSAGQIRIDVARDDVDVLVTGPLKWLLGGPGLAYLYVREELARRLRPSVAGWFGARDQFAFDVEHFEFRDDARRFELGTPALATVHTALGGMEIIEEVGVPAIRERNAALTELFIDAALERGLRVTAAPHADERSAIVMVRSDDGKEAVRRLAEANVIVDARPGHVRVSPHFYNTEEEMTRTAQLLAEIAR